jgi:hypothetical protein
MTHDGVILIVGIDGYLCSYFGALHMRYDRYEIANNVSAAIGSYRERSMIRYQVGIAFLHLRRLQHIHIAMVCSEQQCHSLNWPCANRPAFERTEDLQGRTQSDASRYNSRIP